MLLAGLIIKVRLFENHKFGGGRRMGMRQTLCVAVPVLLGLPMVRTGGSAEPPKPEGEPKVVREQVQGQWRFQGEKLLRIRGRVKVLDAHTLLFEDGTKIRTPSARRRRVYSAARLSSSGAHP